MIHWTFMEVLFCQQQFWLIEIFISCQDLDSHEGTRPRKMDRLRRSFRSSIKRKKDLSTQSLDPTLNVDPVVKCVAESTKQWQADEVAVRSGLCNFQVKVDSYFIKTLQWLWKKSYMGKLNNSAPKTIIIRK